MSNPWMKFYPSDIRAEPTLKMCSWEARWLWIEMICLMHEADPYGHLVVNGRPVTDRQLAALTGTDESTVQRLKLELETTGVYSLSKKGTIYSRRMTRDEKRAKEGRKSVEKRWNQTTENIDKKPRPNRSPNRIPITKKPEAIYQKDYYWSAEIIKLNRADYLRWSKLSGMNDDQFMDWLRSRDEYLQTQPEDVQAKWFMTTPKALLNLQKPQKGAA